MSIIKKDKDYITATKEGRLFIKTSDFFKQQKVKETIEQILKSSIYKERIDKKTTV